MLENGRGQVRTPKQVFDLPCIIRLAYMVKRPFVKRKLSKKEVLLLDRHTCQYCGQRGPELTMDHVRPRRQGGQQTWENIVSACIPCNHRKAGTDAQRGGNDAAEAAQGPIPQPPTTCFTGAPFWMSGKSSFPGRWTEAGESRLLSAARRDRDVQHQRFQPQAGVDVAVKRVEGLGHSADDPAI